MDRSLLDTSTLSDLMQPTSRRSAVADRHLTRYLGKWGRVTFSHVSCYEILRGLYKKHAVAQGQAFRELCDRSELIPVSYAVLEMAANLWAQGQRLGIQVSDADLIIAATARLENLSVVSANPRHFSWLNDLKVSNWREP